MNTSTSTLHLLNGTGKLPVGVLNALIGFNPLARAVANHIDLSNSPMGIVIIMVLFITYASRHTWRLLRLITSSINIKDDNELYESVEKDISQRKELGSNQHVIAKLGYEERVDKTSTSNVIKAINFIPVTCCSFVHDGYTIWVQFETKVANDMERKSITIWCYGRKRGTPKSFL